MSTIPMRSLRVETPAPKAPEEPIRKSGEPDWRKQSVQLAERLSYAENQLKDLRAAADDARARFGKYKGRLDAANARINDLQLELVAISSDRDFLKAQVAKQDVLARKVHEYRQSIIDGPLWELFAELAICPPEAGERTTGT